MEEMQITSDLTWIEVQFMKKAVDEVEKCRMTLKWTYAMAYYLEKCNEKELFEDNQRQVYSRPQFLVSLTCCGRTRQGSRTSCRGLVRVAGISDRCGGDISTAPEGDR